MSRTARASESSTLRMIFSIPPLLNTMIPAPAADRPGHVLEKRNDLLAIGRGPVLDEGCQVAEEGLAGGLVQLLPLRGQAHLQAPTILGMIQPLDQSLPLQLVDDPR